MRKERYVHLIETIKKNENLMRVFDALDEIDGLDAYVGAGAIVQSVWNVVMNKDINFGIGDIDIVFYNKNHIDEAYEKKIRKKLEKSLGEYPFALDVKNQARVHLWYEEKFGYKITPYSSVEDAIDRWPTTATSLGVKRKDKNTWIVYSPFGIDDAFEMKIRANCRQITEEIYINKAKKWKCKWGKLECLPWDGEEPSFINREKVIVRI